MSYDYSNVQATAISLINKFGRTITHRTTTSSGDEFDPVIVNNDTSITAVMIGYEAKEIDGTLIKTNDKMILTYTSINTKDEILDGAIKYEVVNVNEVKPGDTPLIYKVQIRS